MPSVDNNTRREAGGNFDAEPQPFAPRGFRDNVGKVYSQLAEVGR